MDTISIDRMRKCFELNTLGPIRVQQALTPQMRSPGGKIGVITTGMSSISDNTSGGKYAYRTSKTAVNMVARGWAMDLKEKEIFVMSIAPGFVATNFGPGMEMTKKWGAKPASNSAAGCLKCIDMLSAETSGTFYNALPQKQELGKEVPVVYPW